MARGAVKATRGAAAGARWTSERAARRNILIVLNVSLGVRVPRWGWVARQAV